MDCRWMDYDELLSDSPSGWRRYVGALSLKDEEDPEELEKLERRLCRGWCVGGKAFKDEVARELLDRRGHEPFDRLMRSELRPCGLD